MERYLSPAGAIDFELVEKRSKFIARVLPVGSEEAAKDEITRIKMKHHDANHNCWCYIIHGGPERYSDDGEPQGTAGLPMLEVFRREGIFNVCCIVTRYFGGILLGAGGLSRAYAASAKQALTKAGTTEFRLCDDVEIVCGYDLQGRIKRELENINCLVTGIEYLESVVFRVLVSSGTSDGLYAMLRDISAGAVSCVVTGKVYSNKLDKNFG